MGTVNDNTNIITIIFAICTILCLVGSIISIRKEPRTILNGFLIETGIVLLFFCFLTYAKASSLIFTIGQLVMLLMYVIILIMGIILIVDFIWVIKKEGKSIPNILPLAFGILALVVAYFGYQNVVNGISGSQTYVTIMSVLYNIVLYVPYMIGAFLIYSFVYALLPKGHNTNYIIVLGCRIRKNGEVTPLLKGRLDRAIKQYNKEGQKAKFVVSGGQGSDEVTSEANAMKNYLLSKNIPEDKIILEDKSVSTRENLLFSKKKIEEDNNGSNVLICTSNYHVLRAVLLAKELNFNGQGIGGHTALYYLPVAFFREYIAVIFNYKLIIVVYMIVAVITGIFMV